MSAIKSKDTKPEILIRQGLHKREYRFRKNVKNLPGKPDIVLPKYKTVIFVNGCFWHMHNCRYFKLPNTRREWWKDKLNQNEKRDQVNIDLLLKSGWRVLVVWECQVRGKQALSNIDNLLEGIVTWATSQSVLHSMPPE